MLRSTLSLFVLASALVLGGCRSNSPSAVQGRICGRVATLCGATQAPSPEECQQTLGPLQTATSDGAENLARVERCANEARSCGEASGCVAGGALRSATGFLQSFTQGLTR